MSAIKNQFGEFVIDSIIGEGGMGRVYRAWQTSLQRWVALKVLPRNVSRENSLERFYIEARAAARMLHPNIIQIHTIGEYRGIPYFAMEYVEGVDMEKLMANRDGKTLTDAELVCIITGVTRAVASASDMGIIHRDIKPGNIMISKDGLVKVTDFGLAKGTSSAITSTGVVVGTAKYMSPEQGSARKLDIRSDFYSLGCVLYEAISGKPPFEADSIAALIYKHAFEEPRQLVSPEGTDPKLIDICMKLIAKSPDNRYQYPDELLEDIASVPAGLRAGELALAKRVDAILKNPALAFKARASSGEMDSAIPRKADKSGDTNTAVIPLAQPPEAAEPIDRAERQRHKNFVSVPLPADARVTVGIKDLDPDAAPAAPQNPGWMLFPEDGSPHAKEVKEPKENVPVVEPHTPPEKTEPAAQPSGTQIRARQNNVHKNIDPFGSGFLIDPCFTKMTDGRWTYNFKIGACAHSAGYAKTYKLPKSASQDDLAKDCSLCQNWNNRFGCGLAYAQELGGKLDGFDLANAQSFAWQNTGRLDRAVTVLELYIRMHPEDAAAYRELAKLYDRADYRGVDKRRVIVLYERFAELAAKNGGFSQREVLTAWEKAKELSAVKWPAPPDEPFGHRIAFECFYRGALTRFCFGSVCGGVIALAGAGDSDPETGIRGTQFSGAMERATSFLKRFNADNGNKPPPGIIRREIARLAAIPPQQLPRDPTCTVCIPLAEITGMETGKHATGYLRIALQSKHGKHEMFFRESQPSSNEALLELFRRVCVANGAGAAVNQRVGSGLSVRPPEPGT